jgi:ABC-type antimicrobial peptide transport system permease subunit
LTILGVTLSIALTVTMFSIGAGIRESTNDLLREGEIDLFVVSKGGDIFFGAAYLDNGRALSYAIDDFSEVAHAIPALYVSIFYSTSQDPLSPDPIVGASTMGVVPSTIGQFHGTDITNPIHAHEINGSALPTAGDPFHPEMVQAEVSYPNATASQNFTHEISVNEVMAKKLDLDVGDTIYASNTRDMSNSVSFEVSTITPRLYEYPQLRTATMHLSELQYIAHLLNDTINRIFVDLASGADEERVKEKIESTYEVTVVTQNDFFNVIDDLTGAFEGFSNVIVAVTVIVALLFISTIMTISVRERTPELGALRAMGISKRTILTGVMQESFLMSFLGYLFGLVLGYMMSVGLNTFILSTQPGLPATAQITMITPMVILQATTIMLMVGSVAGLIPAYWVTKLNINDVLKGE